MSRWRWSAAALGSLLALALPARAMGGAGYYLYAAAESSDEVFVVRFDGEHASIEERLEVGYMATEIEGPHGLTVDPEGKSWFVTMAHGKPFGVLYRYATGTNELLGRCELGLFPATMEISRATGLLYCVNFDLHGDMVPGSVSVVDPEAMVEVARTTTGIMPHGSRVAPDGRSHYSCAMMSDELYELDAETFEVRRVLRLEAGAGTPSAAGSGGPGHAMTKPTWVHPHPSEPRVFVCLNGAAQVVEVDLERWEIARRYATGLGPYNVVVTPDGRRMVVTYKGAGSVGLWDLGERRERARIPTSRRVTHGVVVSPDSRYAFVTAEGIGGEKGTLDVFDLAEDRKVATVELGLQMGGVAFWKLER